MRAFIFSFSEFLNLSWMKTDKEVKAANILRVSQRFNEVNLVYTLIVKQIHASVNRLLPCIPYHILHFVNSF